MKQNNVKNRGITLIALVITIIILLILAGITITGLKNSGLFEKVQLAKENYKNAQNLEEKQITQYANTINTYINGNRDTITIDREELNRIIDEQIENKSIELDYDNLENITNNLIELNSTYTFKKNGQLIAQIGIDGGGYYYSTIKHNNIEANWIRFHNASTTGEQFTDHTIVNAGDIIIVTHISKLQPDKNIIFIPFK